MVYQHIAFNSAWASGKTLQEFMEHEKHHNLTEEQMKQVHALCKAEMKSVNRDAHGSNEEPKSKEPGI
jgi:Spy/CpxP family protein refolding chaperone